MEVKKSSWRDWGSFNTCEDYYLDGQYLGSVHTVKRHGKTKAWTVRSLLRGGGRVEYTDLKFLTKEVAA